MDFYDEVAHKLIGIEVELSKKAKNLPTGYTTGKARIKRHLLKQKFGINSNLQLESLRDSLNELNYVLVEFDYSSDLFLINVKNFLMNTRVIGIEEIEEYEDEAIDTSEEFFEAAKKETKNAK